MKSITAYTEEEITLMSAKWHELEQKIQGVPMSDLFDNYMVRRGYSLYDFYGDVSDKLIALLGREPSVDEIIMIIERGFYHFGATCELHNRHFHGTVYTD